MSPVKYELDFYIPEDDIPNNHSSIDRRGSVISRVLLAPESSRASCTHPG
jgi:hypothetical protein